MKKIYVGCALSTIDTESGAKLNIKVNKLKQDLRNKGFEVVEFIGYPPKGTPREVYVHDIKDCMYKADAMLAICDHPSTGMGYELGVAVEKQGMPVYATAHIDSKVSNLILGIDHPKYLFERYKNLEDVPKRFIDFLNSAS